MAEKRFQWVYIKDELVQLRDNGVVKVYPNERLEELLNELNDDNKQLKQAYAQLKYRHAQLKHRHSLLYDVCIDAECDRDSYCKDVVSLEKENKRLIKMLDNVANYMQKQHKEVPIDDFVEWWNKIAIGDKYE